MPRAERVVLLAPAAIVAVLLLASGCASTGSNASSQGVLIRSNPPGATLTFDGKAAGHAPQFVSIRRSLRPQVTIASADGPKVIELKTKYRWGRSFLGNFVLLTLAPLGWITDLATGTAWDAQDPEPEPVRLTPEDRRAAKEAEAAPPTIAIAPPQSELLALSDLAGDELQQAVAEREPRAVVRAYRDTLPAFLVNGYDYDGRPPENRGAYSLIDARYVYESTLETRNDEIVVRARRVELATGKQGEEFEVELEAADEWARAYSARRWWSRLVPNSVGINFASENLQVSTSSGRSYTLTQSAPKEWWEQGLQYVSAIEISSSPPRRAGRATRWVFDFVPAARIAGLTVRAAGLTPAPGESDEQLYRRLRIGGGYGGEGGVQMGRHYLYFNLIPLLYWSQLKWKQTGHDRSITNTGFQVQMELGYTVFLTSSWQARLFTRTQSEERDAWEEALRDRLPTGERAGMSAQQTTVGVAVAYRFEPSFERSRRSAKPTP